MINKIFNQFSRRKFLGAAGATTLLSSARGFGAYASSLNNSSSDGVPASSGKGRIVDMHVHFDPKKPNYIEDFLKVSERLNLTALILTPFENRVVVAEAAKQHPTKIVPFGMWIWTLQMWSSKLKNCTAWDFVGLANSSS